MTLKKVLYVAIGMSLVPLACFAAIEAKPSSSLPPRPTDLPPPPPISAEMLPPPPTDVVLPPLPNRPGSSSQNKQEVADKVARSLIAKGKVLTSRKERLDTAETAKKLHQLNYIYFFEDKKDLFDHAGIPPTGLIADWLANEGLIPLSIHEQGKPIDPKKLEIKALPVSGSSQDGVYLIRVNRSEISSTLKDSSKAPKPLASGWKTVFVLKFLKTEKAFENSDLQSAQAGELSKINSQDPRFPIISYAEEIRFYSDNVGNQHFLQLIHAASGESLYKIWEDFVNKRNTSTAVEEAFKAVGTAFGAMHAKFLKGDPHNPASLTSLVHGDAHFQNIYYNFATKRVIFIDNSTVRRDSIRDDIRGFFLVPVLFWGNLINTDFESLLIHAYVPFVKAYLEQFPEGLTRDAVRKEIAQTIDSYVMPIEKSVLPYMKIPNNQLLYYSTIEEQLKSSPTPQAKEAEEAIILKDIGLIHKLLPVF